MVEFELPTHVYKLDESLYLGPCNKCGRRYYLGTSVIRGVEDVLTDIELASAVTKAARDILNAILDEYIHDPHNIPESIRWAEEGR